jgi:hypothetical protein
MLDSTLYADLAPIASGPVHAQRPTCDRSSARPVQRPHTSLATAARDQAATARATSRLTHAGGRTVKPVAFNASV